MREKRDYIIATLMQWNGNEDEDSNLLYKRTTSPEDSYKLCIKPNWNWSDYDYKIIEKEYVGLETFNDKLYEPFANYDENLNDLVGKPVIHKDTGDVCLILKLYDEDISDDEEEFIIKMLWIDETPWDLEELFQEFTFIDGSPCGKLV